MTFLLPGYAWGPSGGFRVVYEYANRLVARGHAVNVIHPRRIRQPFASPEKLTLRSRFRSGLIWVNEQFRVPVVKWHPIDPRVNLQFVPATDQKFIPDADFVFATGWTTVASVLQYSRSKGHKCYLIQGYESYHAAKEHVDATWRAPLHKIVIAKWLSQLGTELGCSDLTYIPNGLNHDLYRLTQPIEERDVRVSMLYSSTPIKGAADGISALTMVRKRHPDIKVVMFGVSRLEPWVPDWIKYYRNPAQEFIVREIYNRSRVYIAPSWLEGSPLPPAEAASCGCAIAATDIGGFREFMTHGINGLLSPPRTPLAMAENICRLLDDQDLRIKLARAAKDAADGLDWERSVSLLELFLHRIQNEVAGTHEAQHPFVIRNGNKDLSQTVAGCQCQP